MGEYYKWVNVDKKEYISPNDFDFGNKRTESSCRGNDFLCALRELLFNEWKGDHVLFLGDEKYVPENTENETLLILYNHTIEYGDPGNVPDTVYETYKNVSCLFKLAEEEARQEISFYVEDAKNGDSYMPNEYGIDINNPFEGLFLRTGRDFLYTINHSKKIYYTLGETTVLYRDGSENKKADPLPVLLSFGRVSKTGPWVGDIIGVSDNRPDGYKLLQQIQLDY